MANWWKWERQAVSRCSEPPPPSPARPSSALLPLPLLHLHLFFIFFSFFLSLLSLVSSALSLTLSSAGSYKQSTSVITAIKKPNVILYTPAVIPRISFAAGVGWITIG